MASIVARTTLYIVPRLPCPVTNADSRAGSARRGSMSRQPAPSVALIVRDGKVARPGQCLPPAVSNIKNCTKRVKGKLGNFGRIRPGARPVVRVENKKAHGG